MYRGKKISVAIAAYNGEKYIEEQLNSICQNTITPDEIVISDDGSQDQTLDVVKKVAGSCVAQGISFQIRTDNQRHGFAGNFEHALKQTTGDFIFLCDQDDIWTKDKIESVIAVFFQDQTVKFVIHNATMIDKAGKELRGTFEELQFEEMFPEDMGGKLDRDSYLNMSVSHPFCHGMVTCVRKDLLSTAIPFPDINGFHDQWLAFCALLEDGCYYLNKKLTFYRLHGANTAGNKAHHGNVSDRLKKIKGKIKKSAHQHTDNVELGRGMIKKLQDYHLENSEAYGTAKRVLEIGEKQEDAFQSGRVIGGMKLIHLFCTDLRFRKSGIKSFLLQLLGFWTR